MRAEKEDYMANFNKENFKRTEEDQRFRDHKLDDQQQKKEMDNA